MRFVLLIQCDTEPFQENWSKEVDRLLLNVIDSHTQEPTYRNGMLRDSKGNMVGRWDYYDDKIAPRYT